MRDNALQGLAGLVALASPLRPQTPQHFNDALQREAEWFTEKTPDLDRETQVSLQAMLRTMDQILGRFIVSNWIPGALDIVQARLRRVEQQREVLLEGGLPRPGLLGRISAAWEEEVNRLLESRPAGPILAPAEEAAMEAGVLASARRTRRAEQDALACVPRLANELHELLKEAVAPLTRWTSPSVLTENFQAPPQVSLLCRYPNIYIAIVRIIDETCQQLQGEAEERARAFIRESADWGVAFPRTHQAATRVPGDERVWRVMIMNIGVDALRLVTERLEALAAQDDVFELHPDYARELERLQTEEACLMQTRRTLDGLRQAVPQGTDAFPLHPIMIGDRA